MILKNIGCFFILWFFLTSCNNNSDPRTGVKLGNNIPPTNKMETPEALIQDNGTDSIELLMDQAISYIQGGKTPMKGVLIFEKIIQNDKSNVKAYWFLANFYLNTGIYDKAIINYSQVIKLQPDTFDKAFFDLAQAYSLIGDTANAILSIKQFKEHTKYEDNKLIADEILKKLEGHSVKDYHK